MNQHEQRDTQLRTDAETRLSIVPQAVTALPAAEALLHELQVHQLEMQNTALRQAQIALAEFRDRYVDLYEFAPVGYLTLNDHGMIAEINLTGVTPLRKARMLLLHKSFRSLVVAKDQDRWIRYFLKAIKQDEPGIVALSLRRGEGAQSWHTDDCGRRGNRRTTCVFTLAGLR
jgi:PAS domain-containing protein